MLRHATSPANGATPRSTNERLPRGSSDNQLVGRPREQHLAAVADPHQPGRPVQGRTEPVARPRLGLTCVDGHPDSQRPDRSPIVSGQSPSGRRAAAPTASDTEGKTAAMPSPVCLNTSPPLSLYGLGEKFVVASQGRPHIRRMVGPQPRRPLDISKQKHPHLTHPDSNPPLTCSLLACSLVIDHRPGSQPRVCPARRSRIDVMTRKLSQNGQLAPARTAK